MSEIQMTHFSYGSSSHSRRRRDVALEDSRTEADVRQSADERAARRAGMASDTGRNGLASRVRLALAAGRSAPSDACSCPA